METINQYLYFSIFNNLIKDYILMWALSLVIFFGLVLLKRILLKRVIHILNDNFAEFKSLVMDLISWISTYLLIALSIYFPLKNLEINYTLLRYIDYIFLFILIYEIIHITNKTLEYILSKKILKGNYWNQELTTYNMFKISWKVIVWVVWLLLFLSNIWFQIWPLLASLWVWGVVLAFALQNILEDIFSSFTIYLDQPFHIWDFVTIGTDKWTVIKIGIKSTRIRTPEWQELVVSNRELTWARIQNFGKMTKRRIEITFGIKYETPIEKTKKINDTIKNIFNEIEWTEFIDSKFFLLWAYSLDFKVYYYITNWDYFDYLDKQEKFNFKLMEEFQKQWIEFAYPTQVLYVNKQN